MSENKDSSSLNDRQAEQVPGLERDKQERYSQGAAAINQFGAAHLDPELTGFALELWKRICRLKRVDCRRGDLGVWAASVIHVIARMNFLFDRSQTVHLTFDTICEFFGVKKNTVGGKASEIERTLRLRQHSEVGLCRREFVDNFTTVQLSNGLLISLKMAKDMGFVPLDATPGSQATRR